MLARLAHHAAASSAALRKHMHLLFVVPSSKTLSKEWPAGDVLAALVARRRLKPGDLAKTPVTGNLKDGALATWAMLDTAKSAFEQQTAMRTALQPLLAENPGEIAIVVCGDETQRRAAAQLVAYCAWVNGA